MTQCNRVLIHNRDGWNNIRKVLSKSERPVLSVGSLKTSVREPDTTAALFFIMQ